MKKTNLFLILFLSLLISCSDSPYENGKKQILEACIKSARTDDAEDKCSCILNQIEKTAGKSKLEKIFEDMESNNPSLQISATKAYSSFIIKAAIVCGQQ